MTYVMFLVFLQVVNANRNANSKLIDKAVSVTGQYYKPQFVTAVIWSVNDSEGVDEFLMKFPGSIVTVSLSNKNNSDNFNVTQGHEYKQIIFFASEPEAFLNFSVFVNKSTKFYLRLVLVLKKAVSLSSDITSYIEAAWANNVVDIVIISRNIKEEILMFTYFPYNSSTCDNIDPVELKPNENVFPNKFNNFNRCPIRVAAVHVPPLVRLNINNGTITGMNGSDSIALMLIANKLNASLTVKHAHRYGSYANSNVTDALNDLVFNRVDIIIPGAVLNGRHLITQPSRIYYFADMRWILPKRRQIYQSIKLLIPFLNNATPFLLLTFTLFIIVIILIRKRHNIYRRNEKGWVCFQAFTLLLGQYGNFMTKVSLLNNLFLTWIWFCFIIRLTYQGILVDSLQSRILEPKFGSIEEALEAVDGYGGSEGMLEFYKGTPYESNYVVLKTLDKFYFHIDRIMGGERFMLILDKISRKRYQHSVQILDKPISSTMVCFYMRLEWPAGRVVDSIVIRLIESGIINKIHSMDDRFEERGTEKQAQPLDLLMISSCFYGMGFMWVVCSIIFLLEILLDKHLHLDQ